MFLIRLCVNVADLLEDLDVSLSCAGTNRGNPLTKELRSAKLHKSL